MISSQKHYIKLIGLILMVITMSDALGQISTTYYHMYGVPQANQLNPAFQPGCNVFLGCPALSPLSVNVESSSVSYQDLFTWDDTQKKFLFFLNKNADRNMFMDGLKDLNSIRSDISTNLMSIGWRNKQLYFTLDITERIEENFRFTKDFAEFAINLNSDQDNFNFSNMGLDLNYYHQFGLGVSYNYEDEFQVGAKAKVLFGVANYRTQSSEVTFNASYDERNIYIDELNINSSVLLDLSVPFLDVPVDENGDIAFDSIDFDIPDSDNPADFLLSNFGRVAGFKNPGFALDFGFNYRLFEFLSISASVIDLGFIRWKPDAYTFEQNGNVDIDGLEIDVLDLDNFDKNMETIGDSILDLITLSVVKQPYTSFLSGSAYIGAAYEYNHWLRLGVVDKIRMCNYHFYNQLTLSANVSPVNPVSATISYSVIGKFYANFGFGISLRAGPFNLYFITDQAPGIYLLPKYTNSMNFRFGLNLVFGCKKIPKKLKDRPLID